MRGPILSKTTLVVLSLGLVISPIRSRAGVEDDGGRSKQTRGAVLVPIAPGTLVGEQPPKTWSHLVIRCIPRLASGDLGTLPRSAFRTATLFRTVILADVGRSSTEPSKFVLRRVGVGLCVPDPSRGDVVVESGQLEKSGVSLGMIDKIVLESAESKLAESRLIPRGPSFALYHGPSILDVEGDHQKIELFYAFLVDEQSGALRVLVWPMAEKLGSVAPAKLVELRPGLVYDCPLNVKAERLLGAVPVSWSFAMESLPPGQPRPVSPELRRYLAGAEFARGRELDGLEQILRRALNDREPQVPVQRTSRGS